MVADLYAVFDNFKNYIGGREGILHWGIFCLALVCCFFFGKRERKLLFWPTVVLLIIFFNPFFYRFVGSRFFAGVYWRLMWMLPISFIVAFAGTEMIYKLKNQSLRMQLVRLVAVVAAVACIAVTGTNIYNDTTFTEAENAYKLPQATIEVADAMAAAGVDWKVKAIVPNELLCYIRQYRCDVGLFYGRNVGGFISGIGEDEAAVYQQMSLEEPDVSVITELAKKNEVVFICFNTATQKLPKDMTGYGYHFYKELGDYTIYMLGEE